MPRVGLVQTIGGRQKLVEPDAVMSTNGDSLNRTLWLAAFSGSGVTLVCCLVVIVGIPYVVGDTTWFYWIAIGSAVLFAVAADQLRSGDRLESADDAAGLARSTRRSKNPWDDLDGVDD